MVSSLSVVFLSFLAFLPLSLSQSTNYAASFPGGVNGLYASIALPPLNIVSLPFTFEAWIQPAQTGFGDYGSVFFTRASDTSSGLFIRTTQSVATELRSSWKTTDSTTSTGLSVGYATWRHVAFVVTATGKTIYLDAKNVSYAAANFTATRTDGSSVFNVVTYLGWDTATLTRVFSGLMDEVRFWSVARSASDIAATLYTNLTGKEAGLLAYYNFDDANATQATDMSASASFSGQLRNVTYATSTVFLPQTVTSVTVQSASDLNPNWQLVAPGSKNNAVARVAIAFSAGRPVSGITAMTVSLRSATRAADVLNVKVYYTGSAFDFDGAAPVFSSATLPASSTTLSLTGSTAVQVGVNYLWITADIASSASLGNSIAVSIDSITVGGVAYSANTTVNSSVVVGASTFFSTLTQLNVTFPSTSVSSAVGGANYAAFQGNAIMTWGGYQYVVYWNSGGNVCLNRRPILSNSSGSVTFGAWSEIVFTDYTITASRYGDNHYTISVGVCPSDGTIHLAFDMHGDPLHYRVSQATLAYGASSVAWSNASFSAVTNSLAGIGYNTQLSLVTYPRFVIRPDSHMTFEFRYGTSGAGDSYLYFYNGTASNWTVIGKYLAGLSLNPTQNAYIFGAQYGPRSTRLHISWCWRQTPDAETNHDLYYGRSDDGGNTWSDSNGNLVAATNSNPMTIGTPGIMFYNITTHRGLINQESQTVDSRGGLHMLVSYIYDSLPDTLSNFFGERTPTATPRSGALLRHFHQLANGTWTFEYIGIGSANRAQIAIDSSDNLYVVAPNWRVMYCASVQWTWPVWTTLDYSQSSQSINEPLIDRDLLLNYGVLAFVSSTPNNQIAVAQYSVPTTSSSVQPSLSSSSSSGVVAPSTGITSSSSSSSTGASVTTPPSLPLGLPPNTVGLKVLGPANLNVTGLVLDIAIAIANVSGSSTPASAIVPFIVRTDSLSGNSRRLLQASQAYNFYVLGNITSVVSASGVSALSAVSSVVTQIAAGTFATPNSQISPSLLSASVQTYAVPSSSSSSSTGVTSTSAAAALSVQVPLLFLSLLAATFAML